MGHIFMFMPVLGLGLFLFLPWSQALSAYLPIVAVSLLIAYKAMQAQYQPPISGYAAMIGESAVVMRAKTDRVKVRYQGEIWQAESERPSYPGQQVMILAVEGLTLQVTAFR